jgi:hypothetical protein
LRRASPDGEVSIDERFNPAIGRVRGISGLKFAYRENESIRPVDS